MKPTAAEMLKLVPVSSSAQMPPIDRASTLDSTTSASSKRVEGHVEQDEDQPQRQRDDDHQPALRPPPSPRTRRSSPPGRATGTGRPSPACASATALARSRPRTLNLTAIMPLALLAVDGRGAGALETARWGRAGRPRPPARPGRAAAAAAVLRDRVAGVASGVPDCDGGASAGARSATAAAARARRAATTWLLTMSTGMSRIDVSLLRSALRPAHGDVEEFLALDHLVVRPCRPGAVLMTLLTSATCTPHCLHFSGSTRNSRFDWPLMWKMPTFSMPWTVCRLFLHLLGQLSSSSRSGPKILTELSPLTPDSASMTLSRMFCEKFQSTPGSLLLQLVVHRPRSAPPWSAAASAPKSQRRQPFCSTTAGQSFSGRSGTKNSPL